MPESIIATCDGCGDCVEVSPPNLPPSGGAIRARDDPVAGWQVLGFTCGECWASRHTTWTCVHCGDASYELAPSCRGCGRARPGLPPYQPDWDAIGKEMEERRREAAALLREAVDEYGFAAVFGSGRRRDRL